MFCTQSKLVIRAVQRDDQLDANRFLTFDLRTSDNKTQQSLPFFKCQVVQARYYSLPEGFQTLYSAGSVVLSLALDLQGLQAPRYSLLAGVDRL